MPLTISAFKIHWDNSVDFFILKLKFMKGNKMSILNNIYNSINGYRKTDPNFYDATDQTKPQKERDAALIKAGESAVKTIPSMLEGTKNDAIKTLGKDYEHLNPKGTPSQPSDKRSEKINQYQKLFTDNYRQEADILFQPLQNTSEDQIMAARNYANYEGKDPSLNSQIKQKTSDWYDYVYGTNPIKHDATGRMINPQPAKKTSSGRPITLDDFDMEHGLKGLSEIMSDLEESGATGSGVTSLQKALNTQGILPQLKEDGILGEKTALQTRQSLAEKGYNILLKSLRG